MNLPLVPTSVAATTVVLPVTIDTLVPLIVFTPIVLAVRLRLTFWPAVPEKVSVAFCPAFAAANVSGSGVPAVIAPAWSFAMSYTVTVVEPAYHCRGSILIVYVPVAGIVNGSRKLPELPKFELATSTDRSGFSTDTRAELTALPLMVTGASLMLTRWPIVPVKVTVPFWPGVSASGTAAPPGVAGAVGSVPTVQSATVALPL